MAGLTDMSMGEIKRLDDNSQDYGGDSMADIDMNDLDDSYRKGDTGDTGFKGRKHQVASTTLPKGNILDELKQEN